MKDNIDILQKAIADAGKIKEIALKAAEKSLHKKYSKELKEKYLKNINETTELDDYNVDDFMLDEVDFPGQEDDPNQLQDPSRIPPDGPEGMQDPNMPSPDPSMGGMEDPLGGGEMGGGLPLNPDGQQAPPDSPVIDNIPGTDEYGGEDIEIEFLGAEDDSLGSDFDSLSSNLDSDFNELSNSADTLGVNQDDGSLGNDPLNSNDSDPFGVENQPNTGNGLNIDSEGVPDNHFDWEQEESIFDSIQINDKVLLEYIERNLKNDNIIKSMAESVKELQGVVQELQESRLKLESGLEKSNKTITELKIQNIRLMLQNKVFGDISLTENQKNSVVTALDKAETIAEAKKLYETAKISFQRKKNVHSESLNSRVSQGNSGKADPKYIRVKQGVKEPEKNTKVLREEQEVEELNPLTKKLFESWKIK